MFKKKIPNILTVSRILLSPFFIFFMIQNEKFFYILSFLLILLISLTDFFDGYYARKYDLVTDLGKYLDPLADKIFVLTVFFTLYYTIDSEFFPLWMLVIILLRDILVTFLRNLSKNEKINFETSKLAKNKTLIQVICMHLIVLILILNIDYLYIYIIMLVCTIVTVISGLDYFYQYFLKNKNV